ncbi:small integral membrane protein 29-like [Stegostoma tigrinum]|uniref:small integral membrane protein 29-like n=1 Tax=Stegostoma tigrinum TaxID=3053191 RepID=UPI00202B01FB|nr:small integral membrane protein 29-like [Stegostoma tigrinum]XP_059508228.1 small integral membrane protein 29-like [Stegostoma tigrinum]
MPNQTASPPSDSNHSASILGFMLIPVIVIAVIGIAVVVVKYVRKRRRLEKLRNKLVPIYSYDPSEDRNDVEEESLDRSGEGKDNHESSDEKASRLNDSHVSTSDTGNVL